MQTASWENGNTQVGCIALGTGVWVRLGHRQRERHSRQEKGVGPGWEEGVSWSPGANRRQVRLPAEDEKGLSRGRGASSGRA